MRTSLTPFMALILFFSLLLLPPFQPVSFSSTPYQFERVWPVPLSDWSFSDPRGVAVDEEGNIYVTDAGADRIMKFGPLGKLVTTWGKHGSENGEFNYPEQIHVSSDGFLYVSDEGNNRIQKFTLNGEYILKFSASECRGVTTDAEGNVYVSHYYSPHITRHTSIGSGVSSFGSELSNPPWGMAVGPDGFLYVADRNGNRVVKYTTDGDFVLAWGSKGTGPGQFDWPYGLTVDSEGHVYVCDGYGNRIQKFDAQGNFIDAWGGTGLGNDELNGARAMACDQRGHLFVAEIRSRCIKKFSTNGDFLGKLGVSQKLGHLANPVEILATGTQIYVVESGNHRIQAFSPEGQPLGSWGSPGSGPGQLANPQDMAFDSGGSIYVIEKINYRVQKLDPDWNCLAEWGSEGSGPGEFQEPGGIAVSGDTVYVSDQNNHRIQVFDTDGNFIKAWSVSWPRDIEVSPNGDLYVATYLDDHVYRYDADGTLIDHWGGGGTGDGKFADPVGIGLDPRNGNVYVADFRNHRIQVFTPDGDFIQAFGTRGSAWGCFNHPSDVAVDDEGRVYVVESYGNRVQVFTQGEPPSTQPDKAVIVAGGGSYQGNSLWSATQMAVNFAWHTLVARGFSNETIQFLSENTTIDLDGNSALDDVDGSATLATLEEAITTWAHDGGCENLVVFLADHGEAGTGAFRINESEWLQPAALDAWLDQVQDATGCRVIVVVDACFSGSFLPVLNPTAGQERIVIASASADEGALIGGDGTVSFSNYFWSQVFNRLSVEEAFAFAEAGMAAYQTPELEDWSGGALASGTFIGSGTTTGRTGPEIGWVTPDHTVTGTTRTMIAASGVTDEDGVARVWAVAVPPGFGFGGVGAPMTSLPTYELASVGGDAYEADVDYLNAAGTYRIVVYAMDMEGFCSVPEQVEVVVESPLTRKAVIVAGDTGSSAVWDAVQQNATLACEALKSQLYTDEDIHFLSSVGASGVDGGPSLANLEQALTGWATANTQDLVVYLVGLGEEGGFYLNDGETLSGVTLDEWLDQAQGSIDGPVTVVCDAPLSGSLIPQLVPPQDAQRFVISGTTGSGRCHFANEGKISFSRHFWSQIAGGSLVYDALCDAKNAMQFSYPVQIPVTDANGDGVGGDKPKDEWDRLVAATYRLGAGLVFAADAPTIGTVVSGQSLYGTPTCTLWAEDVGSTGSLESVWAVILPPGAVSGDPTVPVAGLPVVELASVGGGRYEGEWDYFTIPGTYEISICASNGDGWVSTPARTTVYQDQAILLKGDVDGDGDLDEDDVTLALQVLAGRSPQGIRDDYAASGADVNGDGEIGMEEVVYIQEKVQGIRGE